jgi:thioesterase domain-containing protein/acyl carrier protein
VQVSVQSSFISTIRKMMFQTPRAVAVTEASLPRWSPGRVDRETGEIDEFTAHVIKVVAGVTGFAGQIKPSDDFIDDLGGTSLGILGVLAQLQHDLGIPLRMSDALADTSVAGLASLVGGDPAPSPSPVDFAFNTEGGAEPIFLFHIYLGGILRLRRFAQLLPSDQPVYGLQVRGTDDRQSEDLTLASLAEDGVRRVRMIQPTGRVTLIGHSAGGLFAFEVARKLIEAGAPEPRVLLIDGIRVRSRLGYYLGELASNFLYASDAPLSERFGRLRSAVRRRVRPRSIAQGEDFLSLAERDEIWLNGLLIRHRFKSYRGAVTVMRTRHGQVMAGRRDLGWAPVVEGPLEMVDVPGAHVTVLDPPHLQVLVQRTLECLSES